MFLDLARLVTSIVETLDALANGNKDEVLDKNKRDVLLSNGNIIQIVKPFIIEPTILVVDTLKNHEYLKDTINYNINIFSSIFIMAAKALALKGYDTDTIIKLLSTHDELTIYDRIEKAFEDLDTIEVLAKTENGFLPINEVDFSIESNDTKTKYPVFTKEIEVRFDVKIKDGSTYQVKIPMLVRAPVFYISNRGLTTLYKKRDVEQNSEIMRFYKWRAGSLSTAQYVLGLDMLADLKYLYKSQDSDIIKSIQERINRSNAKAIESGVMGLSKYFMIIILDKDTRKNIESNTGFKLFSNRGKDRFLESLKAMMVTELDDDVEMATFATISLDLVQKVRYKMLKTSNNKGSIEDLFKLIAG